MYSTEKNIYILVRNIHRMLRTTGRGVTLFVGGDIVTVTLGISPRIVPIQEVDDHCWGC